MLKDLVAAAAALPSLLSINDTCAHFVFIMAQTITNVNSLWICVCVARSEFVHAISMLQPLLVLYHRSVLHMLVH